MWQNRDNLDFNPSDPTVLSKHRIKPFYGLRLGFINFCPSDPTQVQQKNEFEELAKENGAQVVDPKEELCSHFVLNAIKGQQISINLEEFYKTPDFVVYKSVSIITTEIVFYSLF